MASTIEPPERSTSTVTIRHRQGKFANDLEGDVDLSQKRADDHIGYPWRAPSRLSCKPMSLPRVWLGAILLPITLVGCPVFAQVGADASLCFGDSLGSNETVGHCTTAIESGQLSPANLTIALLRRAGLYRQRGEGGRALADIDRALRLSPDNASALFDRGITYYVMDRPDLAVGDFTAVISLWPESAEAFDSRGKAYSVIGAYDEAISDFNRALGLRPDTADYLNNRGSIHSKTGDFKRAVRDFDDAIRLDPNHVAALYNRGMAYVAEGDADLAKKDFLRADKLAPGNPAITNRLEELKSK